MMIDLAGEYYAKPKLKPWEIRSRIKHYQAQLAVLTDEGQAVVQQKIREWERCIG